MRYFQSVLVLVVLAAVATTTTADKCSVAGEHDSLTLSCASGEKIAAVTFASYGTPDIIDSVSCQYATSSCHAQNSLNIVRDACVGKASCTVAAENSVFGDPCYGVFKRLAATYSCASSCPTPLNPKVTVPSLATLVKTIIGDYCDTLRCEAIIARTNHPAMHVGYRCPLNRVVPNSEGCVFDDPFTTLVHCICQAPYTGARCEMDRRSCDVTENPNRPDCASIAGSTGRCMPGVSINSDAACECKLGWVWNSALKQCTACRAASSSCNTSPRACNDHGFCVGGYNASTQSYIGPCKCVFPYVGCDCERCDDGYLMVTDGNCAECPGGHSNPCNGHGTCVWTTGAPQCQCSPGWCGSVYCDKQGPCESPALVALPTPHNLLTPAAVSAGPEMSARAPPASAAMDPQQLQPLAAPESSQLRMRTQHQL